MVAQILAKVQITKLYFKMQENKWDLIQHLLTTFRFQGKLYNSLGK